jgi:hypothetical protein
MLATMQRRQSEVSGASAGTMSRFREKSSVVIPALAAFLAHRGAIAAQVIVFVISEITGNRVDCRP